MEYFKVQFKHFLVHIETSHEKTQSVYNWYFGWYSNPVPPNYKSGASSSEFFCRPTCVDRNIQRWRLLDSILASYLGGARFNSL